MNTLNAGEIRRILFDNDNLYAVIGMEEMTNIDARKYLFTLNSSVEFKVIDNGTHLLIF